GANPANHECGNPCSSWAVPVLPATPISKPDMALLAVPDVTTERIAFARNADEPAARTGRGASLRRLLESSIQRPWGMKPPDATVAETRAILNGVITTGPCP